MKRSIEPYICEDLRKKMVFLGGPRQVGKTTLAQQIGPKQGYLNWDFPEHRRQILQQELPNTKRWIFDELHKYKGWRNYLKGLFDHYRSEKEILVTGSARLDLLRRSGDSLQGRYHYLRLYPITLDELDSTKKKDLELLFELSGFPEPFLGQSEREARRWSQEYRSRVLQEDISSVELIEDLGKAELLLIHLPKKVGAPLSLNSLREDLEVSHRAVKRWVDLFEKFYAIFTLQPMGVKNLRTVKKERKHYHYDWTLVEDPGLRFENLLAVHLLKRIHFFQDTEAQPVELQYYRDTDKREVDFVLMKKNKPIAFIESKYGDQEISNNLLYLRKKFPSVACFQVSYSGKKSYKNGEGIRVIGAAEFLGQELLQLVHSDFS